MNKIRYEVRTAYGDWYKLDADGHVLKYSNGLDKMNASVKELATWRITGALELAPFGRYGRSITIKELASVANERELRFKNGKPRYTLTDIDNGTSRVHGNTRVHGISLVREVV